MLKPNRTVLCVDDDLDDREIVSDTIIEIDSTFTVAYASNGLEALTYLEEAKERKDFPCLIILDINMPKLDGKQTLAQIKRDKELKSIPVVIFTTSDSKIDQLYCAHYGVQMVTKPIDIQMLKEQVKSMLELCNH